ncbi:SpdD protein [Streptomyces sp. IB2014 016-6]|uniref:SpdD protein n=1 Tax=Streptomyces sp. IB2014 016-6 TaxID=2517818 RepID=UPI0011CB6861|nr:SpdD protein [Streptomyces sp. IB2014 016-6]TXL92107.1 SpdD protein [Streptomyces sp. IB2014 016-6]
MFTPKYPTPDTAPATPVVRTPDAIHPPAVPTPAPVPVPVASARPTVQLTPAALVTVAIGGTTVVLVVGAVLVSLLLAVAITGASVAVCAVVLRSLLNQSSTR